MPSFHGRRPVRRADVRPFRQAEHLRTDAGPHVDERVAGDEHVRSRTVCARRVSFEPATRWSSSTPSRRSRVGPNSATASARSSAPCIGSTTMPSSRRSSPQTCSTSSASWLALDPDPARPRHVRAASPSPAIDPEAVTGAVAGATSGGRRVTGRPSMQESAGLPAEVAQMLAHDRAASPPRHSSGRRRHRTRWPDPRRRVPSRRPRLGRTAGAEGPLRTRRGCRASPDCRTRAPRSPETPHRSDQSFASGFLPVSAPKS